MKLNGGRKINITNGFNRTLLHNELNQRKLFKDVDTFLKEIKELMKKK